MLLNPGDKIRIRDVKDGIIGDASVVRFEENELSAILFSEIELPLSGEAELEIPYEEDALYIYRAKVSAIDEEQQYSVQLIGEPQLLQRRRSQRIPTNHRAEYILSSKNNFGSEFHEGMILNISRTGALLAVKESLPLCDGLFIVFEINAPTLPEQKVIPTGIKGKVIREHSRRKAVEWYYTYGVEFEKPFSALAG